MSDRFVQHLAFFLVDVSLLRAGALIRHLMDKRITFDFQPFVERNVRAMRSPNARVYIDVARNSENPGCKIGFVAEAIDVFIKADEHLPRDVGGIVVVSRQRESKLVQRLFVSLNQCIPRGRLSVAA